MGSGCVWWDDQVEGEDIDMKGKPDYRPKGDKKDAKKGGKK